MLTIKELKHSFPIPIPIRSVIAVNRLNLTVTLNMTHLNFIQMVFMHKLKQLEAEVKRQLITVSLKLIVTMFQTKPVNIIDKPGSRHRPPPSDSDAVLYVSKCLIVNI